MFFNMNMSNIRARVAQFVGNVIDALKIQRNNHSLEDCQGIDVEMNVLGAHTVDLDLGENDDVDRMVSPSRLSVLLLLSKNRFREIWISSGIKDAVINLSEFWYNIGITFCIALCLFGWAQVGYPGARIVFPFHKATGELLRNNYYHFTQMWPGFHATHPKTTTQTVLPVESHHFHELTRTYIVDDDEDKTYPVIYSTHRSTVTATQVVTLTETIETLKHAPGFYFFPSTATISDDFWQAITPAPKLTTAQVMRSFEARNVNQESKIFARNLEAKADTDSSSETRHRLDAHDGGFVYFKDSSYIKPELEECASELAKRLRDYGMRPMEALKYALNNCYNDHVNVLEDSYSMVPSATSALQDDKHKQIKRDIGLLVPINVSDSSSVLDEACALYERPPASHATKWTAGKCTWTSTQNIRFHACADTFCDQFLESRFHKCYKVSNSSAAECRDKFHVLHPHDYLDDAVYECQLCVPRIDCGLIEEHCQRVQKRETSTIKYMLLCVLLPVGVLTMVIWLKHAIQHRKGRQQFVPRQAKEVDEEDIAIDDEATEDEVNEHDVELAEQSAPAIPATDDEQPPGVHRRHASTLNETEE